MNETGSNYGWLIILLIFIVVLGAMFGNTWGNKGEKNLLGAEYLAMNGCGRVSNCEVEKQTIINTATTQNLIHTEAEKTRDQASRINEANQAEKLFDAKLKIQALESSAICTQHYNELSRQIERSQCVTSAEIARLSCESLKRPPLFGVAAACDGTVIPPIGG